MLRLLYDGWELAYQPNGPAALHLLAILAHPPEGVQAIVGLPAASFHPLSSVVESRQLPVPPGSSGRLRWEQRLLPALTKELGVDLLHVFHAPPLFSTKPVVLSPAEPGWAGRQGRDKGGPASLSSRLREALGSGGLERLRALFWPQDLASLAPRRAASAPRLLLPAFALPDFSPAGELTQAAALAGLELPERFVLHHFTGEPDGLERLLAGWSWAAGPVGGETSLLVAGVDPAESQAFKRLKRQFGVVKTARLLPPLSFPALAAVYAACTALFQPDQPVPWGGPLRLALSLQKPIVGLESPLADAILGPAAYLVPELGSPQETSRALGAALITLLVEESVAASLAQAARQRIATRQNKSFSQSLGEAYRSLN